jgi:hypothetical protein
MWRFGNRDMRVLMDSCSKVVGEGEEMVTMRVCAFDPVKMKRNKREMAKRAI